jgi:2'-5' RNA ligase
MANLKATFALLPDAEMQNRASAAAVLVHGASGGRLRWPRLPPHVSLKQPFSIESLATIERYFDQFAADTAPIAATLGRVQTQPTSPNTPESVVWVSIDQPSRLRAMHERLNRELRKVVTDAQAPLDGEGYEFHMTLGFLPGPELSLPGGVPGLSGANTTFRELGLFVYDGLPKAGWQCMRYKVLPLTGRAESGLTEESRINWEHVRRSTIEYYEKRPSLGDAWDNEPAGVFPDAAPEEARLGAALCKVVAA